MAEPAAEPPRALTQPPPRALTQPPPALTQPPPRVLTQPPPPALSQPPAGDGRSVPAEFSEKPPYSYVAMIALVLEQSPEQRLTLRGIYEAIERRFPYYSRLPGKGWQNSVRHNLSLNRCFLRLPRQRGQRSSHWVLAPSSRDMFPGGNYQRRQRHRAAMPPLRYQEPAPYHLQPGHYQLLTDPWGPSSPLFFPRAPSPVYPSASQGVSPVQYWEQELHYRAMLPPRMDGAPPAHCHYGTLYTG